jgi:hypothetical protein
MKRENDPVNYTFIDPNIRGLVKVLNSLEGVRTMGCCGGHKNPGPTQRPAGHWFVTFWVYKRGRATTLPMIEAFCKRYKSLKLDGPYLSGIKAQRGWYAMEGTGNPQVTEARLLREIGDGR